MCDAEFLAVDSDDYSIDNSSVQEKIFIEPIRPKGLGPDFSAIRKGIDEKEAVVREYIGKVDMTLIVTGGGGGTSLIIAPAISSISRDLGALTIVIATTPFSFEGQTRKSLAVDSLSRLKNCSHAVIPFHNQSLIEKCDKGMLLRDVYFLSDDIVSGILLSLFNND